MCRLICRDLRQTELCLPVFYVLLDPSLIPDTNNLEHVITTRTEVPSIDCAIISLDVLCSAAMRSSVIQDAAPDLWPRVWPWVHFVHTFRQFLPGAASAFRPPAPLLLGLAHHPQIASVISATRGVRSILAYAWEELVSAPTVKLTTRLLPALIQDVEIFENFEEILTAVGGADKLVLLVLKHISLAIAFRETETKVALLADVLLFLVSTSKHEGFPSALLSQEIIPALVSALDALLQTTVHFTWPAIHRGIRTLKTYLPIAPMHPWVREAVEAGFLRFLVCCAVKHARGPPMEGTYIYEELGWIMKTILAQSLVSCSVVTAMHSALKEVQSSPEMEEFAQLPLFSVWTTLATLVEHHARVLNSWKSAGSPWLAACNNMTCGKIKARRDLKRCAHCTSAYYCSSDCQRADWCAGHREICQSSEQYHPHSFDKQFHRHERAFMHALVAADYKRLKSQISCDIISFMQAHPDSPDAYLVHFDYTEHTGVKATIQARRPVPELFAWYRNRRLYVVSVAFGLGPMSQYILPLRENTTFNAGLHRIAEEIPTEADESWVENKVRELMQSTEEVVEIH
ncbi:MYND-type domain-containing protein [Mycena venus]|uniref:MYND-type domain-containing protein n=1 Tax=Mycena venus TaxID=2733690 RepID=A0A8H7D8Y0_9AGAR|nr:MYND-type domain-containing protein [Mycena venus]